jgi:hypothetical protein
MLAQMAKQVQVCTSNPAAQMDKRLLGIVASGQDRGDGQRTGPVKVPTSACKDAGSRTSIRRAALQTDDTRNGEGMASDDVPIGLWCRWGHELGVERLVCHSRAGPGSRRGDARGRGHCPRRCISSLNLRWEWVTADASVSFVSLLG